MIEIFGNFLGRTQNKSAQRAQLDLGIGGQRVRALGERIGRKYQQQRCEQQATHSHGGTPLNANDTAGDADSRVTSRAAPRSVTCACHDAPERMPRSRRPARSTAGAPANVQGSSGSTLNSNCPRPRVNTPAEIKPTTTPIAASRSARLITMRQTSIARCAEREAHADFLGAFAHRVGNDAVDTDGREG